MKFVVTMFIASLMLVPALAVAAQVDRSKADLPSEKMTDQFNNKSVYGTGVDKDSKLLLPAVRNATGVDRDSKLLVPAVRNRATGQDR